MLTNQNQGKISSEQVAQVQLVNRNKLNYNWYQDLDN